MPLARYLYSDGGSNPSQSHRNSLKDSSAYHYVARDRAMSNPLDITVEQARRIVLDVSRSKGWMSPETYARQDAEGLVVILALQEQLGNVVEK